MSAQEELQYCPQCGGALTSTLICFTCQVVWERTTAAAIEALPPPPTHPGVHTPRCPWCLSPLDPQGHCWNCLVVWAQGMMQGGPIISGGAPKASRPSLAKPTAPRKPPGKLQKAYRRFLSYVPPVRLVWIFLGILIYVLGGFGSASSTGAILGIAALAVVSDLVAQATRFKRLRIPDASLAMAMFLGVLLEPPAFTIELAAVTLATVLIRHIFRQNGRPWLNPTAVGLTIAYLLWGNAMTVPWNVGIPLTWPEYLMVAFGLLLILRQRGAWRIPFYFFLFEIPLSLIAPLAFGRVPLLTEYAFVNVILSPYILFYGLFMVPEPRTSPGGHRQIIIFSILVAVSAVFLPLIINELPGWQPLSAVAPFLALFVGNLYAVFLRRSPRGPVARKKAAEEPRYVGAVLSYYQQGRPDPRYSLHPASPAG